MHTWTIGAAAVLVSVAAVTPALAQSFAFERSFDVTGPSILDVSTARGRIEIVAGEPGRVVVSGAATVRVDWNVPANAAELARKVASRPPVRYDAHTIRLRVPDDRAEQRAVTVSYRVQVPPDTGVLAASESGATSVRGVAGAVVVRTRSGAVELTRLGGAAEVISGSGSVAIDGVPHALSVTTSSSSVVGRSLGGSVRVRTGSGAVDAQIAGDGDVDVETGSSAIRISGARRSVNASSGSGRISISGVPNGPWTAHSRSGALDMVIDTRMSFSLDLASGSGSVRVDGATVQGALSKRRITGAIDAGGPLVRASSRSGAITLRVGGRHRSSPSSPPAVTGFDPAGRSLTVI